MTGHTCKMKLYIGKRVQDATNKMTPTHTIVRHFTRRGEGVVCKLYVENFFSSLALIEYLTNRK